MAQHILVGKTIIGIDLSDDRQAIRFRLADGDPIVARCDGDCCSHTWIEDVLTPESALGEVINAEDVDLPEHLRQKTKTDNYEEEMAYYGFVIDTAKGRCVLAYRNSSNGYYGGSLNWPDDRYYYGGVYGQNKSKEIWVPLDATATAET